MRGPVVLAASLLVTFGCGPEPPKLAATGTGDVSHPPAPRGNSAAALEAACGSGGLLPNAAPRLNRRPYLQQLGAGATRIVASVVDADPVVVDVTLPGGAPVASAPMVLDESVAAPKTRQVVASVDGLAPGTLYCYALRGLTAPAGFRTAPAATDATPLRFVAFGDSGTGDQYQRAVYTQMRDVPFDFVVHLGDLAYEKGTRDELAARFFGVYRDTLSSFPVFPVLGNHDDASSSGKPYLEAFVLPENSLPGSEERHYSFDWGHAHFVALDTERIDAEQAAWLDRDLEQSTARWNVVLAHRPAFSSGYHGGSSAFRRVFGPVLQKHGVPLVLSGHEHDYERVKAQSGTTYVVSGGGGRSTRAVGSSSFTAYAEDVLHFLFVEIDAERIAIHAIDGVGREFDSDVITRN